MKVRVLFEVPSPPFLHHGGWPNIGFDYRPEMEKVANALTTFCEGTRRSDLFDLYGIGMAWAMPTTAPAWATPARNESGTGSIMKGTQLPGR